MIISAGIFIINEDLKLLIVHPYGASENDKWSIPKGKVENSETFFEAAIRETYEEANFHINLDSAFQFVGNAKYKNKKKQLVAFSVLQSENPQIDFDQELKCNSYITGSTKKFEIDEFKWVSFEEAENLLHYTQIELLPNVKELLYEKS